MDSRKWRFLSGVLAVVLVALLMAGMAEVQAAQSLHVAKWTTPQQQVVTWTNGTRPTVLYDNGIYKMWYIRYKANGEHYDYIQYTTSTDGINWAEPQNTSVLGYDTNDCPFVTKEGGTYYMFNYKDGGNQDFYVYTSTDGINWTVGNKVFTNPNATRWVKIDNPMVINDGGTYKMYFQVKENATGYPYYILLATSNTIDGTYAVANGGNPVLSPGASGQWDSSKVMQPMVVKDGSIYYMWYSGYSPSDNTEDIGFAYSTDGVNWTKGRGNPVIGMPGDSKMNAKPSVVKVGDTWKIWYQVSHHNIYYASATGPFQFASIQDAINAASSGDTIIVAPGIYSENLLLSTTANLIGLPGAVINGVGGNGITTSATGAVINGFTIKDYSKEGILVNSGSAAISNNVIEANATPSPSYSEDSIYIKGNANVAVSSNTLCNNHYTGIIYNPATNDWSTAAGLSVHDTAAVTAMYNSIYNNDFGIHVKHHTATVVAHYNDIHGNTVYGFFFEGVGGNPSSPFDAALNWWGDANGPTHASNPAGAGDRVSDHVIFSPWLGIDPDGDPTTPGVQITGPMLIIVAPVGPAPAGGYLNTAIAGANSPDLPYTDTIKVKHGTYDASTPITQPVRILSQQGSAANTHLTGNMSLNARDIIIGRMRQGFSIHGNLAVGAGVDASTIHINWNDIYGTVANNGTGTLDATYNFWDGNAPWSKTIGAVDYYPYLPDPTGVIIGYIDNLHLTPDDAITYANLTDGGMSGADALTVLHLMHSYGFSEAEAQRLVREYGRVRIHLAMMGAYTLHAFSVNLLGYGTSAGGGGSILDHQIAGGGGSINGVTLSASYVQGEPIHIAFTLTDPITGKEVDDAIATLSVVRVTPGEKTTFIYWGMIPYDAKAGQYKFDYDTSRLKLGYYDLYIGTNDGQTQQFRIEVTAS